MQITVSGKQVDLSSALETYVSEHLETITHKYFDHALQALITFGRARSFFTCDINLHAGRRLLLQSAGEAADAHAAFDAAAERIAKRLRRYRRRVNEHARYLANRERPEMARRYILAEEEEAEAEAEMDGVAVEASGSASVVAESPVEIALLSVRDAAMRLDLADQQLMMFRNRATGMLNVIYRRTDGHIGWIEPVGEKTPAA